MFQRPGEGATVENPVGGQVAFKLRDEKSGGSLTPFETVVAPCAYLVDASTGGL